MSEVSSCIITVQKDQRVKKGEQLGYFQFGGSTHCLVFEPGVIKSFDFQAIPNVVNPGNEHLVKVNSQIAVAN
jgi:phosphatidylserine decarboxylase